MKKAIHIAGLTIGVIVLYALAIAALAQNPPQRVHSKGSDWEDCKALAGPEGLQCRVLPNGRDIEVRSVAVDSDCKPPSCLPVSKDPVCSVGSEFVPCPSQKVRPAPFDVPAVTIDKWDPPLPKVDSTSDSTTIVQCEVPDLSEWVCDFHGIFHHHIQKTTCADTSRYLLHSEDGKAHCLKLVPHD